jgi:hypothetical protein
VGDVIDSPERNLLMPRRPILLPLVAAIGATAVALPLASHGAEPAARTIDVTFASGGTAKFDDVPPLGLKRERVSMGDRIFRTQRVMVGGKAVGTLNAVTTATNPAQVPMRRLRAVESIAVDLGDGVLLGQSFVDNAHGGEHSAIVGGTGAYAGATGSVAVTEAGFTITLDR